MIVEQAIGIPYVWDDNIQLWSKDVEGVMNAYFSGRGLLVHDPEVGRVSNQSGTAPGALAPGATPT